MEALPLLVLPPPRHKDKECLHLHLASTHRTSPIGAYLSVRLHRPGDYRHLQEVHPASKDSGPMGLRSMGLSTAYAGTERSPGNTASSSAEAMPACYSLPAGGAAAEPACYSIPAGCAAAQEASREGIDSPTPLRQSPSCSQSNHPRLWKATGQGTRHQRQISQSPRTRARDDNQCSLNYHTGSHAIPTRPSFKAQMPQPGRDGIEVLQ